jgi:hypothetical protein
MGNDNHVVVSHELCGFQELVGRCVVVMMEPVVVAPKFQFFSLHIFSQASQNVTVRVRVDRRIKRNKFTVNNPLQMDKKPISMLFVELRTCCAFFALGDCGLLHCDDCCFVSRS